MLPEVSQWVEMAQTDLRVARHLFDTCYPMPYEVICYHCQQSAEKAIKALIISKGAPGGMPKLHDLSFLLNQIKKLVDVEDRIYDYADALTPYGISVRYPNELFLEKRHAEKAIQMADEILAWVKDKLN